MVQNTNPEFTVVRDFVTVCFCHILRLYHTSTQYNWQSNLSLLPPLFLDSIPLPHPHHLSVGLSQLYGNWVFLSRPSSANSILHASASALPNTPVIIFPGVKFRRDTPLNS